MIPLNFTDVIHCYTFNEGQFCQYLFVRLLKSGLLQMGRIYSQREWSFSFRSKPLSEGEWLAGKQTRCQQIFRFFKTVEHLLSVSCPLKNNFRLCFWYYIYHAWLFIVFPVSLQSHVYTPQCVVLLQALLWSVSLNGVTDSTKSYWSA